MRESLLLRTLGNTLKEDLLSNRLVVHGAIISSSSYEPKDKTKFLEEFHDLYRRIARSKLSWLYSVDERSGKLLDKGLVTSANPLIDRYRQIQAMMAEKTDGDSGRDS